LLFSILQAVIYHDQLEYNEALLPLSESGTKSIHYVVIGEDIELAANQTTSQNTDEFTINGVDYINADPGSVKASPDNRYYISYEGSNALAGFTLTGINDWTTQDHLEISLPFSGTATTSAFYMSPSNVSIDTLISSDVDLLLINNVDYSNRTVTGFPEKLDGKYYIYYGVSSENSPRIDISPYKPVLNIRCFLEGAIY